MTCRKIVGGVDTHKHTHHVAVIGTDGVLIASREFPATSAGHSELVAWVASHGTVEAVGVEGTGSFGAPVARCLKAQGIAVVEVMTLPRGAKPTPKPSSLSQQLARPMGAVHPRHTRHPCRATQHTRSACHRRSERLERR